MPQLNSPAPPKASRGLKVGVKVRLVLSLALVTIAALTGGAFSILGLDTLHRGFDHFIATQLPALTSASRLARQSESVVASAPALVLSRDQFSRTTANDRISDQVLFLDQLLANLRAIEQTGDALQTLEGNKQALLGNLQRINEMVERRIGLEGRGERIVRDLVAISTRKFDLVKAIASDAGNEAVTRDLLTWSSEAEIVLDGLLAAFGVQKTTDIGFYRRQASEAFARADRIIGQVQAAGANFDALRKLNDELRTRVTGPDNLFAARNEVLSLQQSVGGLLARNKIISDEFGATISGMLDVILRDLDQKSQEYTNSIELYRKTLIVCIAVALLVAIFSYLYISRRVIQRIVALRDSMLTQANGIASPIDTSGRDEISDMARALKFFVDAAQRREETLTTTKDQAEDALHELRRAQQTLIHTEKLASLGQLTAGVAHEIKNPLNFVNNFSALSVELVDELRDVLTSAALDGKARADADELTDMLKGNLDKVVQHGKRADSIIKNMLLHSRTGSGEHRPVDLNALVDESINLAYHGARAERPGFNVTLSRDLDPTVGLVDIYPQEVTRVLLNLIGNGFYATDKRKTSGCADYVPTVSLTTRNGGEHIEIRVRDNGTGVPDHIKAKMFDPFFTTKPAGEGTGLGLSLSHDIIVKQHGGTIGVASEAGRFTEFTIRLPRNHRAGPQTAGRHLSDVA